MTKPCRHLAACLLVSTLLLLGLQTQPGYSADPTMSNKSASPNTLPATNAKNHLQSLYQSPDWQAKSMMARMSYLNQSGYDSVKAQRYDDAEVYWQENLALAEHIFGKNSNSYINQLLSKSSNTLLFLKKPELAKSLALQALEITNTLKDDSLQNTLIVSSLRNIAWAQSKLKEYSEAEINLKKILDMETQYKAKEDSEMDLSISYDSLGDLYVKMNRYDDAEKMYLKGIDAALDVPEKNIDLYMLDDIAYGLTELYDSQKQYDKTAALKYRIDELKAKYDKK